MKIHEKYIKRCIEIAKNGLGATAPNPMVGCVIVYKNQIISEGYTSAFGGNHAEVNAISKIKDLSVLKSATLYVTLEPCSHYGKTPPCSNLIIEKQIPKVVIGCVDDNPLVAKKGIAKLEAAGCEVMVGVLEAECKAHHKRFFTFHNKKRPYIILKWAETKNGYIAPDQKEKQEPVWITNRYSRQLVHKWRAEEQAILVGTNTVLDDDPSLTVRDWTGKQPLKIVLDHSLKLPKDAAVYRGIEKVIVISSKENVTKSNDSFLENTILESIDWQDHNHIAQQICDTLYQHHINSVIIEGGSKTLQTFIDENLWDEARVFTGSNTFNDGILAPKFSGRLISEANILTDNLSIYNND
ncbi:bifunctional diaminohydroxyphosphoribosylaminopyrimidine deaminase/5-amino-6-(5-phosphoribosylamino)uracil reductase RibD [Sediminibacter sp. Hel_I_10]|uniref:bifunctional diaminohydroxyphosphoribosylaminopyrimidine deaminase/5-amino-6-(5-phosphoribosylamino)uracil reductase RibD n=1 Tax=Sediminibacter sp. Hel_I_10 TaxID=1392490 RepID=UPI00047EF02B|nr:bifunctional diaminohydroxyphosphoribosylaminopyrimidine deaminase/5-amino-6-(5-phosphoribosylamino)uracil reductase RibD [Sediminibacter sp. Hel_I_10]